MAQMRTWGAGDDVTFPIHWPRRWLASGSPQNFPPPRADELWRPDRPSRLFPQRIRCKAALARRARFRRPRRALPVPARPGEQPGRLRHRADAGGLAGRARRLGGVHPAVGDRADPLCLWRRRTRRAGGAGAAARAQARRRRRRRPGGARDGAQPDAGRAAGDDRRPGGAADGLRARGAKPDRGDRARGRRRPSRLPSRGGAARRNAARADPTRGSGLHASPPSSACSL